MTLTPDTALFKPSLIEKVNGKRDGVLMTVGGIFQRADTENANKRVYPKELWKNILTSEDVKERLENRRMVGMFGHPDDGKTNEEKISHVVTRQELRNDGTIYGEADILDTPSGRIVSSLFEAGVMLGISSRGDGSIAKKGGASEVQNDFKLETYDFVLRPSTPGAFPGLLESAEDQKVNEKKVAEAIAGLVKQDLKADQRLQILTESLEILSVLEADISGNLIKEVSSQIQEVVKDNKSDPIVVVKAKDSVEKIPESIQPQETQMPNPVPAPTLSGDMLIWHQNQIAAAVNAAVHAKESELANVRNILVQTQKESLDVKKKLQAAESIIEEFQQKVKSLREAAPSDARLRKRYEAAVDLLDAAIERLPEIGQLRRRGNALEGLLEAAIKSAKNGRVQEAVKSCVSKVAEAHRERVQKMLEGYSTPEAVHENFKRLTEMFGPGHASKEPLPPAGGTPKQQVNESVTKLSPSGGNSFSKRVGNRLKLATA